MSDRDAVIYACGGRVLVAVPGWRIARGPRFDGPPLDPLAEPADEEAVGRLALAALAASRDDLTEMEDHDDAVHRAAGVRGEAGLIRECEGVHLREADGRLTVMPLRNLGQAEGFTYDVDRELQLADRDPASVGRAIRRAIPPKGDPELERDLAVAAEWIAEALDDDGYDADFSRKSAREIDRFYDANLDGPGQPTPGGRFDEDRGRRLFALGAYVGTILEREAGARWDTADADGDDVPMLLPDGGMIWPIRRAIDRFELGDEAGIGAYVASLAPAPERRGLRRLLRR